MLSKLEKAGNRASKRKSEFFLKRTKWLGHGIDENGIKPNEEKVEAIQKLKSPNNTKLIKIISRRNTIPSKISTETIGKGGQTEKIVKKERTMALGRRTRKRFQTIKTDADR